jgi:hypothetical protein
MNRRSLLRGVRAGQPLALVLLAALAGCIPVQAQAAPRIRTSAAKAWSIRRAGAVLQIGYGSGTSIPQYAALDLHSGYFRMVYSRTSGWGTSIVLLPALWSRASCRTDYCQGAPVTASWRRSGADLRLSVRGTIATLRVTATVTLIPPAGNVFAARVSTSVAGTIRLDRRPGEAFKPVMLSSMHISATRWDALAAFTATRTHPLPPDGWILRPPTAARDFGLLGGTSSWKANAPTIDVVLNRQRLVTGWVTPSTDPNGDNVAFWCATGSVLASWTFTVTARGRR